MTRFVVITHLSVEVFRLDFFFSPSIIAIAEVCEIQPHFYASRTTIILKYFYNPAAGRSLV